MISITRRWMLPFLCISFLFSCSTDKDDDNNDDDNAIVGTWFATELKLDGSADAGAQLAKGILDKLTSEDCYIIKFTFNSDMSAVVRNSVEYVYDSLSSDGTSLDIPCPSEEDVDEGTYAYENNVLTITDGNGDDIVVDVVIDGDSMTLDASDLDVPSLDYNGISVGLEGQLVFEKQ